MRSIRAFHVSILLVWMCAAIWVQAGGDSRGRNPIAFMRGLPLLFEKNHGQAATEAQFIVRGPGSTMLLTPSGLVFALYGAPDDSTGGRLEPLQLIHLNLVGVRWQPELIGEQAAPSRISYLRGTDPSSWLDEVAVFRKVRYKEVYPGIDLIVYGRDDQIEYDFEVAPGADPTQILWEVEGAKGIHLDSDGSLVIETGSGVLRQLPPHIFQEISGIQTLVEGRYEILGEASFGFRIDSYHPDATLTIDPILVYSTYLGGSKSEVPGGVAVDTEGHVYLTGSTGSLDFPLRDPAQPDFAGGGATNGDIFVTKIDASGEFIVYSTYIGGEGTDIGRGIAVDSQQRPVVVGTTFSDDFPSTASVFQPVCSGQCPFVFRLDSDGSALSYATFVGRGDGGGIAVDSLDQVVITGRTTSATFPIKNAFQPNRPGRSEAFVAKLNTSGTDLVFSTYLGGSGDENLIGKHDIATDNNDNIYVVGKTDSADFPLQNALQESLGGEEDGFVTKWTSQGVLIYSTYLGGTLEDEARGVSADEAGNAYVVGNTLSLNFPVQNAFQPNYGGGIGIGDAFLAKLDPQGNSLVFSTYLGGEKGDTANDVAVDAADRPVVVGNGSSNFPVQVSIRPFDGIDNYVAKFLEDGSGLFYSTPIGAGDADVFVTSFGTEVLVTGNIASDTFPLLNPLQPEYAGAGEVFLTRLSDMDMLYFAQFGNGAVGDITLRSDIVLPNPSATAAASGTVTFSKSDGSPFSTEVTGHGTTSSVDFTVSPLDSTTISTSGQGDFATGTAVVSSDVSLGGVIRFDISAPAGIGSGIAGVPSSQVLSGFVTPVRRVSEGINTGVAIRNVGSGQVDLNLSLRGVDGVEVPSGATNRTISGGGQLVDFITSLFPDVFVNPAQSFVGTLVVTSDGTIAATAIEQGINPGEFTTLPVTPLE